MPAPPKTAPSGRNEDVLSVSGFLSEPDKLLGVLEYSAPEAQQQPCRQKAGERKKKRAVRCSVHAADYKSFPVHPQDPGYPFSGPAGGCSGGLRRKICPNHMR
jgi:hypothetical protein